MIALFILSVLIIGAVTFPPYLQKSHDELIRVGKRGPGQMQFLKFAAGKKLTIRDRVLAWCYMCNTCGYQDGVQLCGDQHCVFYPVIKSAFARSRGTEKQCAGKNEGSKPTPSIAAPTKKPGKV